MMMPVLLLNYGFIAMPNILNCLKISFFEYDKSSHNPKLFYEFINVNFYLERNFGNAAGSEVSWFRRFFPANEAMLECMGLPCAIL